MASLFSSRVADIGLVSVYDREWRLQNEIENEES